MHILFFNVIPSPNRYPRYERFGALFVPNHVKTKLKRQQQTITVDDSKICPLQTLYDADIHDALANLRRLDGTIPKHDKYGPPVNFFAPPGIRKYWVKSSTPVLGYYHYVHYIVYIYYTNYFVSSVIFCSILWIKRCVQFLKSTLICRYGIPRMNMHWTSFLMLKLICELKAI
jgi:hypothetical protein